MIGQSAYRCEACRHFDTDGIDGNHPSCREQSFYPHVKMIRINEECPFGYEFGIPSCYPVNMDRNKERAYKVKTMMCKHAKKVM